MGFEQCDEYLKKIYSRSVKKSKFSFSCHLQIDKKINNVKEDPTRKTDSNFPKLPSAYDVLTRGVIMQCISQNSLYQKSSFNYYKRMA